MAMCLNALDLGCTEDEVNNVMGARPMKGAAWEQALACAQHYGCRATLTMPSTVEQLKAWTDAEIPVMIAWNPEGRPWSHASVVFDVDDDLNVYIADPNIPNPKKTVRVVSEDEFYTKWYEKFPNYLVRRPACAIQREITSDGRQILASFREASLKVIYAGVMLDDSSKKRLATWWESHTGSDVLPKRFMHHMTIAFRPKPDEIAKIPVGKSVNLKVTGWADNGKVQAIAVKSPIRSKNAIPHITVATDGVAKPFESNALLAQGYNQVSGPVLSGRVGFFTPNGVVYENTKSASTQPLKLQPDYGEYDMDLMKMKRELEKVAAEKVILKTWERKNSRPETREVPYKHAKAMVDKGSFFKAQIIGDFDQILHESKPKQASNCSRQGEVELMELDDFERELMAEEKEARFKEGPAGKKQWKKWFNSQSDSFKEDWEENTDRYKDKFK